jgi:hypothetical protein
MMAELLALYSAQKEIAVRHLVLPWHCQANLQKTRRFANAETVQIEPDIR